LVERHNDSATLASIMRILPEGEEPADDAWVMDWSMWAGAYKVWLRRRAQYQAAIQRLQIQMPVLSTGMILNPT